MFIFNREKCNLITDRFPDTPIIQIYHKHICIQSNCNQKTNLPQLPPYLYKILIVNKMYNFYHIQIITEVDQLFIQYKLTYDLTL